MANTENSLQGGEVSFKVRPSGTSGTFKTLVCTLDDQFQLTNDVNEKDSRCGTHLGIKHAKGNISGNAVCNISPSASEVSYDEVTSWQINKTLLEFQYLNDAATVNGVAILEGAYVNFEGEGYFTDTTLTATEGETLDFSFTFRPSSVAKA